MTVTNLADPGVRARGRLGDARPAGRPRRSRRPRAASTCTQPLPDIPGGGQRPRTGSSAATTRATTPSAPPTARRSSRSAPRSRSARADGRAAEGLGRLRAAADRRRRRADRERPLPVPRPRGTARTSSDVPVYNPGVELLKEGRRRTSSTSRASSCRTSPARSTPAPFWTTTTSSCRRSAATSIWPTGP